MRELLRKAVDDAVSARASYAEARFGHQQREVLHMKDGKLIAQTTDGREGISVRVLRDGAWGAAGGTDTSREASSRYVRTASANAGTLRSLRRVNVVFPERPGVRVSYATPARKNPFEMPLEEKTAFMYRVLDGLAGEGRHIDLELELVREGKLMENSEGTSTDQEFTFCGFSLKVHAEGQGTVATRVHHNFIQGGFEVLEDMGLEDTARSLVREAVGLLSAPPCPEDTLPVILSWDHMAMLLHETIGHNFELDRILGYEETFAGTSFVRVGDVGTYRYASPIVNVVADATTPRGIGTYGVDDEGVPAQVVPLIRDGVVAGFISGRESAAIIGAQSGGAARGTLWEGPPIDRMTNVNLLPGPYSLEDLIADTPRGIYMVGRRMFSVGPDRRNYLMGSQVAYEIAEGKLGRMFRGASLQGDPNDVWRSCDAIGNHPLLFGAPTCGKGELMQPMRVGHYAPAARFSSMKVRCLL